MSLSTEMIAFVLGQTEAAASFRRWLERQGVDYQRLSPHTATSLKAQVAGRTWIAQLHGSVRPCIRAPTAYKRDSMHFFPGQAVSTADRHRMQNMLYWLFAARSAYQGRPGAGDAAAMLAPLPWSEQGGIGAPGWNPTGMSAYHPGPQQRWGWLNRAGSSPFVACGIVYPSRADAMSHTLRVFASYPGVFTLVELPLAERLDRAYYRWKRGTLPTGTAYSDEHLQTVQAFLRLPTPA